MAAISLGSLHYMILEPEATQVSATSLYSHNYVQATTSTHANFPLERELRITGMTQSLRGQVILALLSEMVSKRP